jgi:hypothetical protein
MLDLAEDLSRQADRLWSHLPEELVPGDEEEVAIKTDSLGNLMVAHGESIYLLRDDVAWVYVGGEVETVSAYKDRQPVGDALVPPPLEGGN